MYLCSKLFYMKVQYLLAAVVLSALMACNSSKIVTGEVNYIGSQEPGTIQVSAAGYGATKKAAIENAERNAFYNLLFKGIPGSQYNLPMVPDGDKAQAKHKRYFTELLDEAGYKRFMMHSEPNSAFRPQVRSGENVQNYLKIDVTSLRRDLESHQIIRKFGY